jgi:hypothetical protein
MRRRDRSIAGRARFEPSTVMLFAVSMLCVAIILILIFVIAPSFEALLRKEG